jgi:hypothetical protein
VSLLRRQGRIGLGLEAGYQRFGTEVTRIDDFNQEPGAIYREEIRRRTFRLVAVTRIELGGGSVRPYAVAGAGGYDGRFRDRIEVRNAQGERVPLYDFDATFGDLKAGLTAGLGVEIRRRERGLGLALEQRWHGILDYGEAGLGTANYLSFGLVARW